MKIWIPDRWRLHEDQSMMMWGIKVFDEIIILIAVFTLGLGFLWEWIT